ncbi:HEPN domain-containing protein [Nonomuraea sp. SYSU D8015]|uniref:HEPN domain-containing protein n=1 Tax=Nonomuraea sp. SYSU D8015 TaxID=2593644 RepID=UPI00166016AE|nr:HEPN domain-containing protein [Nonomuraea sp. SYSU D8015]
MRWGQGRAAIEGMLSRGEIEKVVASRSQAEELLDQAAKHLTTARLAMESDPIGAYQLLYDAARKALCAVLENQGLRATSRGGHIAVYEAVNAQLDPPLGKTLRSFDRMRRRRNEAEYPRLGSPGFSADDVRADIPKVEAITEVAAKVIDSMPPF